MRPNIIGPKALFMKNLMIIWNVILTGLVVYLFTLKPESAEAEVIDVDSANTAVEVPNNGLAIGNVFYVNTDSLFSGLDMYKDMQEELVAEQLRLKKRYETQLSKLEVEYNDLRDRAPYMTQTQGEAAQQKLMVKQQDLVKMEENLGNQLAKKESDMVKKIKSSLNVYLAEIQEEKGYQYVLGKSEIGGVLHADTKLDLTNEVLEGLNKKYREANQTEK